MLRRKLLVAAALVPLAACTTSGDVTNPDYAKIAADIDLIANGLKSVLNYVTLTGATRERYAALIDHIAAKAKELARAADANSAKSIGRQVVDDIDEALNILSGFKLPWYAQLAVTAVQTLLSVVSSALGLTTGHVAARPGMTPAQARETLRGLR